MALVIYLFKGIHTHAVPTIVYLKCPYKMSEQA